MSHEIAQLLGRRNLTNIPKDQQKILDRGGIGAVAPPTYQPDFEDAPPHVLSTVIDAYLRGKQKADSQASFAKHLNSTNSPQVNGDGHGRLSPDLNTARPRQSSREHQEQQYAGGHNSSSPPRSQRSSPPPQTRGSPRLKDRVNTIGGTSPSQAQVPSSLASSPERLLSWPPSPERDVHQRQIPAESLAGSLGGPSSSTAEVSSHGAVEKETMAPPPKPNAVSTPQEVLSSFLPPHFLNESPHAVKPTSKPRRRRRRRSRPRFQAPPGLSCPSSDSEDSSDDEAQDEEEALEVELPQAQGYLQPSTQNSTHQPVIPESSMQTPMARPPIAMETPPCAQPSQTTIPGTLIPSQPIQTDQPLPRPARRMKPMVLPDLLAAAQPDAQTKPSGFQRMASTKTLEPIDSSNTTNSSSMVPASLEPSPMKFTLEHADTPLESVESLSGFGFVANIDDMLQTILTDENPCNSQQQFFTGQHDMPVENVEDNAVNPSPYEVFLMAYPQYETKYSGSLKLFVKACICLEHMSKHRSLNHSLWDDFIRAFSAEYLGYVRNTQSPLVASEWYNDRDELPLFEERIVQKGNISHIIASYPEETASAKRYIKSGPDGLSEPRLNSTADNTPSMRAPSQNERSVEPPKRKRGLSMSGSEMSKARAVTHSMGPPQATPAEENATREKVMTRPGVSARHSLGSLHVNATTRAPRRFSENLASATPPSSLSSTPMSTARSGYLRRLLKPRSAQDQQKTRDHISKRAVRDSSFTGN